MMGDPILVRAGKRLVPTPRALDVKPRIEALAAEARAIIYTGQGSDLAGTDRLFTIRADESFATVFAGGIVELLNAKAPRMRLRFVGRAEENVEALRDGSVDLESQLKA